MAIRINPKLVLGATLATLLTGGCGSAEKGKAPLLRDLYALEVNIRGAGLLRLRSDEGVPHNLVTALKADEGVPQNLVTALKADDGVPQNLVTAMKADDGVPQNMVTA